MIKPHQYHIQHNFFDFRYPANTSSQLNLQLLQNPSADKYSAITAYGASKLCNLLFMMEFHRRNVEDGVSCNAVHPGNLLPTGLPSKAGLLYQAAFAAARPFTKSVVSELLVYQKEDNEHVDDVVLH